MGWPWRAIAFVVTALRFPILLAWIAAAVAATVYLPAIATSGNIDTLIPKDAPAVRAEVDATRLFGVPLSAQVAVVQRNPRGFTSAQIVTAAPPPPPPPPPPPRDRHPQRRTAPEFPAREA